MPAWEYRKIALSELPRKTDDIDVLCEAGEEGWELVAILANNIAYLKRELNEPLPARLENGAGTIPREQDAGRSGNGSSAGWSAAWKIDPVAGWTASNTDP